MNGINQSTSSSTTSSLLQQQAMKITINLNEKDIIKLIIEFLANRDLNISMLDVERETGIINSQYSDDILFLRQLILDGQWDDALEFIQPLKQIDLFNSKQFYYLILKYQYLELLCLKSEAGQVDNQLSVDQLVTYLNDLRQYSPSDDEYKKLCLLLTLPRLQDHTEYKNWNPSSGRLQCFKEILPLVNKFLTNETTSNTTSSTTSSSSSSTTNNKPLSISQNERLIQLIVKGLLYESCVEYCQARATSSIEAYNLADPNILLLQQHLSETDASLLSWLHALPIDTFSCPFEEKPLKLNMDKFIKPNLEATWADAILATPIKPQQLFPYNAVPTGRSRNTELMSRSLAPQYEGLSFGLSKSQIFTSGIEMNLNSNSNNNQNSLNDNLNSNHSPFGSNHHHNHNNRKMINDLTRSIGLFNFETNYSSSSNNTNGQLTNNDPLTNRYKLNGIKEEELPNTNSPSSSQTSLTNNANTKTDQSVQQQPTQTQLSPSKSSNPMQDSTLFMEYKKNKAQIIQQLEEQEKKREEYVKQLKSPNVYNALNAVSASKTAASVAASTNKSILNKSSNILDQTTASRDLVEDESLLVGSPGGGGPYKNSKSSHQSKLANGNIASIDSSRALSPNPPNPSDFNVKSPSGSSIQSPNLQSPVNSTNNLNFNNNNNTKQTKILNNSNSNGNLTAAAAAAHRPINETTKFDSLEDITKAASFQSICTIEDQQAIRAVDIHPSGNYYVVGSNSKCLRICPYPSLTNIRSDYQCKPASVLYKKSKHHYGSIYCVAWNPSGNLIATGSNDKTIKLIKFSPDLTEDTDSEIELTYHNGTVRDLVFMQQEDNNILISGGAGDCKIHVLDCHTQQSLRVYTGHTGHIYSLYTWSGTKNVFVSGSQDKTCRFWDLRTPEAIQLVAPSTTLAMQGSPVAGVAVDPSGLLLASGHEDAACCLYDIRGSRIVQIYKPHSSDIRSVRFSTNAYYLLTSSYDNKIIITDLHGDLTKPLSWSIVAQHNDKIIQAKWHPTQMSFISTSADRTSVVWSLPSAALASASVV